MLCYTSLVLLTDLSFLSMHVLIHSRTMLVSNLLLKLVFVSLSVEAEAHCLCIVFVSVLL